MSRRSLVARTGAQAATGGVAVAAGTNQYRLLLRLAGRRLDTARIHRDPRDTP
jgi:hypothetical protein